jgi:hypothetical protein
MFLSRVGSRLTYLERLVKNKHSDTLQLQTFINYGRKKFYNIDTWYSGILGGFYLVQGTKQPTLKKVTYREKSRIMASNSRECIQNTSFSLQLINGPSKLERYIRLGHKVLPVTNTLGY